MKQKSIMLQGTASSVGKSLLTAALCRIFWQDGFAVNPFKSQNMSLNSYITPEGDEIGRAQVMQAECCGVLPHADMNPVLLKPTGERRCQVVFQGRVLETIGSMEYYSYKDKLIPGVREAFGRLRSRSDIVVLEGAGSPAEINLRRNDFVNMGMAKLADSPVILVGDIDKGGVFASLYGTVMLLEPEERARIKGIVINKFRGDIGLLTPGLAMLEELVGIPVLGVVPYLSLNVEEEDSATPLPKQNPRPDALNVGIVKLPYLSNFTDANALALEPETVVSFLEPGSSLAGWDVLVIPGTKNTLGAMRFLQESGMADAIRQAAENGAFVAGICGGFQLLGKHLHDPMAAEGEAPSHMQGLGLLDVETEFLREKATVRSAGRELLFGTPVQGYEIHMGRTRRGKEAISFLVGEARDDGAISPNGRIFGTYYHGIFDNGDFTRRYLNSVRAAIGKPQVQAPLVDYTAHKEQEYNKLAEGVRQSLDMKKLYQIVWGEE